MQALHSRRRHSTRGLTSCVNALLIIDCAGIRLGAWGGVEGGGHLAWTMLDPRKAQRRRLRGRRMRVLTNSSMRK